MIRYPALHPGYERLIGAAAVDSSLGRALLRDPHGTALRFGIAPQDADMVTDIRAADLQSFAAALLQRLYGTRLYGKGATGVPQHSAVVG